MGMTGQAIVLGVVLAWAGTAHAQTLEERVAALEEKLQDVHRTVENYSGHWVPVLEIGQGVLRVGHELAEGAEPQPHQHGIHVPWGWMQLGINNRTHGLTHHALIIGENNNVREHCDYGLVYGTYNQCDQPWSRVYGRYNKLWNGTATFGYRGTITTERSWNVVSGYNSTATSTNCNLLGSFDADCDAAWSTGINVWLQGVDFPTPQADFGKLFLDDYETPPVNR
jgi:hypothetical protein